MTPIIISKTVYTPYAPILGVDLQEIHFIGQQEEWQLPPNDLQFKNCINPICRNYWGEFCCNLIKIFSYLQEDTHFKRNQVEILPGRVSVTHVNGLWSKICVGLYGPLMYTGKYRTLAPEGLLWREAWRHWHATCRWVMFSSTLDLVILQPVFWCWDEKNSFFIGPM